MGVQVINYAMLHTLAGQVAEEIYKFWAPSRVLLNIYAVPRGGIPAALAVAGVLATRHGLDIVLSDSPDNAEVIIDDLIDSGATALRYAPKPFFALIDKRHWNYGADWVQWPWEGTADGGIEDNVRRLLQFVGEDPNRGGLAETPARVAKAWGEWCSGYGQEPGDVLKTFDDGAEGCDEMVVVRDLPIYSMCEHHMASIFGTATIAYIPNGKVVGLSKLARLADIFARRLQVQERLTVQIADALMEHIQPKGCGVVIKARHMCMESRGICQQGHHTVTSALRGVFKTEQTTRAEFLALVR